VTFTLEDAGILEPGAKALTKVAKYRFTQDVMDAMRLGSGFDPPFFRPCGAEIPPLPLNFPVPDLHDTKKFPDFETNCVTKFFDVASKLNLQSQQPFVPIAFDPLALALKLDLKIPPVKFSEFPNLLLNLPALLLKLELTPLDLPDLMAKLPSIGIPPQPFPPEFPLPGLELPYPALMLPELLLMYKAFLTIPLEIPKLLLPTALFPMFALKFSALCGNILKILPPANGPNPTLQIALHKVLAVKMVECIVIDVVGLTLGSASGGATGALGKEFGYTPPPPENEGASSPIRDKIIKFAKKLDGVSYSSDTIKYTTALFPEMVYKNDDSHGDLGNYQDKDDNGKKGKAGSPKPKALAMAKMVSSCGVFVRGCLIAGGAGEDNFFTKEYVAGSALSGLISIARRRNAILFDRTKGDKILPPFKKGDFIIVGDKDGPPYPFHAELVLEDFDGEMGAKLEGIGGGALDEDNPTADGSFYGSLIVSTTYKFAIKSEGSYVNTPFAGPQNDSNSVSKLRPILAVIDSEKIIENS
jgi:hypothetical protein